MTFGAGSARAARVPRLSYFFPAHNEEANVAGLVEEALDEPAGDRRDVRDHHRQRRLARPHTGDRRRAHGAPSRRRPRGPPSDQPGLRRGAAQRVRCRALRPRRLHRWRSPVPGRGHRAPDRATRGRRCAGRRRRVPHPSSGPDRPDPLCARLPPRQSAVLRAARHRRRLCLQGLPARGARRDPRRVGGRVLLGGAVDQAARGRAERRPGRGAALPAPGGLADRRQAVGHPAGGPRLLAPPLRDVGEPRPGAPPGPADRGGVARDGPPSTDQPATD